jgi:hypothetical protein
MKPALAGIKVILCLETFADGLAFIRSKDGITVHLISSVPQHLAPPLTCLFVPPQTILYFLCTTVKTRRQKLDKIVRHSPKVWNVIFFLLYFGSGIIYFLECSLPESISWHLGIHQQRSSPLLANTRREHPPQCRITVTIMPICYAQILMPSISVRMVFKSRSTKNEKDAFVCLATSTRVQRSS